MSDFSVYRPQFPELLAKTLQPGNKVPHTTDHVARLDYNCPANFIAPPQLITIVPPFTFPQFQCSTTITIKDMSGNHWHRLRAGSESDI